MSNTEAIDKFMNAIPSEESISYGGIIGLISNPLPGTYTLGMEAHLGATDIICLYGNMECIIDGVYYRISKNESLTILSNLRIDSITVSPECKGYIYFFERGFSKSIFTRNSIKFVLKIIQDCLPPKAKKRPANHINLLNDIHNVLRDIISIAGPDAEESIRLFLRGAFLTMHENKIEDYNLTLQGDIADKFVKLVESDDCAHNNVAYFAKILSLSSNRLYTILKQQTGRSALEWINDFRINKAKALISSMGEFSLNYVAENCGFQSLPAFTKFFKGKTGITPSEFRNQILYSER